MPASNLKSLVDAELDGSTFISTWRKSPTQTTGAGIWFDLSMSPGTPVPNYYIGVPGVFTPLKQSTDGGISHGGNVAPLQKFLRVFGAMTVTAAATPLPMLLCDYLGFYPFLDESVTDEQFTVNSTPVPRYPLGDGVQMMPVVVGGQIGGQTFRAVYTNSAGVTGRMTPRHAMTTQAVNGTIISSAGALVNSVGPFMALQAGDTGVRALTSIIFEGVGDIGLISMVLVKPIARHYIRGIDAFSERDFLIDNASAPQIIDDAYLNLICLPNGNLASAPIYGYLKTAFF